MSLRESLHQIRYMLMHVMMPGEYELRHIGRALGYSAVDLADPATRVRLGRALGGLSGLSCNDRAFWTKAKARNRVYVIEPLLPEIQITIEGATASGKTFLANKLATILRAEGHACDVWEDGLPWPVRLDMSPQPIRIAPRKITIFTKHPNSKAAAPKARKRGGAR